MFDAGFDRSVTRMAVLYELLAERPWIVEVLTGDVVTVSTLAEIPLVHRLEADPANTFRDGERPDRQEQVVEALVERELLGRLGLLLAGAERRPGPRAGPGQGLHHPDVDVQQGGQPREHERCRDHPCSFVERYDARPVGSRPVSRATWSVTRASSPAAIAV